jgi:hypothetical protein
MTLATALSPGMVAGSTRGAFGKVTRCFSPDAGFRAVGEIEGPRYSPY